MTKTRFLATLLFIGISANSCKHKETTTTEKNAISISDITTQLRLQRVDFRIDDTISFFGFVDADQRDTMQPVGTIIRHARASKHDHITDSGTKVKHTSQERTSVSNNDTRQPQNVSRLSSDRFIVLAAFVLLVIIFVSVRKRNAP